MINSPYNIQQLVVYLSNKSHIEKVGNHAYLFWLYGVDDNSRSVLNGNGNLGCGLRVLGVEKSAEGTAKNLGSLPYTTRQVERASEIIHGVREGRLPASKLEKVSDFLEILRK